MRSTVAIATVLAALAGCCLVGALAGAKAADAAGAQARLQCSFRAVKVTETGNRLDAKGRLKCTGGSIRRQVLRVCLLQDTGPRLTRVKCVTHALNGPGLVTGTVTRLCGRGPEVGFVSRVHIRVRLTGGSVRKASTDSSPAQLRRDCI